MSYGGVKTVHMVRQGDCMCKRGIYILVWVIENRLRNNVPTLELFFRCVGMTVKWLIHSNEYVFRMLLVILALSHVRVETTKDSYEKHGQADIQHQS